MILGMSLSTFTTVHVIISLIGIASGIIVMFGLLGSRRMPGMTAIFLLFTILTSATGFLIPPLLSEKLLPSHMVGILSLVLLAVTCFALYVEKLSGAWRSIYVVTAMTSLYLNIFVLVIQAFLKVPALHALAPSVPPSEPPFAILQGIVLVFFVIVIIGAIRRFRPMPTYGRSNVIPGRCEASNPEIPRFRVQAGAGPGMTSCRKESCHANHQDQRRHRDLLQGLGQWTADGVLAWLAAVGR